MVEVVEIDSLEGSFITNLIKPEKPGQYPAIILIHEIWGLNNHIRDVANRLAMSGYVVMAPDLLSQTGIPDKVDQSIMKDMKDPATRAEAQAKLREATAPVQMREFATQTLEKLQACFNWLQIQDFYNGKIACVGFCFGGTYTYALAVEQAALSAAVVFYGHAPEPSDKIAQIACPVLVFNGEKDENSMKQLPGVKEAAEKFSKDFQFYTYENAGHAFFNNTNPVTYNPEAANDAWVKTLEFLSKTLG